MKKKFFRVLALAVMATSVVLTSCNQKDTPEDPAKNEVNVVENGILKGEVAGEIVLDANKTYTLDGSLLVLDGGNLIIPAGTTIRAKEGFSSYILVLQGGKIFANGTAEKPITFTCEKEVRGGWGGLIINGKAPISGVSVTSSTEVASEYTYGGTNTADNSGVLTYVKLLYTGANNGDDIEHNGLTLNAVGNKTKIENIYVEGGMDDAIEFFGGSVNVTNFLSVDADDDMFDFTQGYTGTLKNCYGVWTSNHRSAEKDPRGVEADGNLDGKDQNAQNQSNFTIDGMTIKLLAADGTKDNGRLMYDVIKIRRGATATIKNALVKGTGIAGDLIDLTDGNGNANVNTDIHLTNSLVNPFSGKDINKSSDEYAGIVIADGNAGADVSAFAWTGYQF